MDWSFILIVVVPLLVWLAMSFATAWIGLRFADWVRGMSDRHPILAAVVFVTTITALILLARWLDVE